VASVDDVIREEQAREGSYEFYREEMRRSSKTRICDCNCTLGRGDLYRYAVGKVWRVPGLVQTTICDVCMRHGNKY
jgi:hypothetical protein